MAAPVCSSPRLHGARAEVDVKRRLLALLACVAAGALIGALVQWLAGRAEGWLAMPVLLAAGWLFVADPTQCEPPRDRPAKGRD